MFDEINKMVAGQVNQISVSQGQWTLGGLIDVLKRHPKDNTVRFDFPGQQPGDLSSYRGFYDQIAIDYEPLDKYDNPVKIQDFIKRLEEVVGKTFTGYKGGEYTMSRETMLWVDEYGSANSIGVVGARDHYGKTIIETKFIEV